MGKVRKTESPERRELYAEMPVTSRAKHHRKAKSSIQSQDDAKPVIKSEHSQVMPKLEEDIFDEHDHKDSNLSSPIESKARAKKCAYVLPEEQKAAFLDGIKPLAISPGPPPDFTIKRSFLREMYGGSDQQFIQKISGDRNPSSSSERKLIFPEFALNPYIPSFPGDPGVLFTARQEVLDGKAWTLFTKIGKEAVWTYLGEYTFDICGRMCGELFESQDPSVQESWGKRVLKMKKWDVYVGMHARISLRKKGMSISDENLEGEMVRIRECHKKKRDTGITTGDIIRAFKKAEEFIPLIRMRCAQYDHIFMSDMQAKRQTWTPAKKSKAK